MANTNCLEGMACPKCGAEGPFKIEMTSLFTIHDDGTDENGDTEWGDESYAECAADSDCGFTGVVKDFRFTTVTCAACGREYPTEDEDIELGGKCPEEDCAARDDGTVGILGRVVTEPCPTCGNVVYVGGDCVECNPIGPDGEAL